MGCQITFCFQYIVLGDSNCIVFVVVVVVVVVVVEDLQLAEGRIVPVVKY